jgi:hypothetical protein
VATIHYTKAYVGADRSFQSTFQGSERTRVLQSFFLGGYSKLYLGNYTAHYAKIWEGSRYGSANTLNNILDHILAYITNSTKALSQKTTLSIGPTLGPRFGMSNTLADGLKHIKRLG